MDWLEIKIKVQPETEDLVMGILYDLGVKSIDIEDSRIYEDIENKKGDWDYVDLKELKPKREGIFLNAYFSREEEPEKKLGELRQALEAYGLDLGEHPIETKEILERDWSENWKKYYKTTRIGKNIVIKPSWETYKALDEDIIIELDPGMAFGTGTHETTSMCAEALETYVKPDSELFDIGTGSGILSIVAGKLGCKRILGVDLDPRAVKVARENVEANGLKDLIDIKEGDLFKLVSGQADIVVANIMADIIIGMAGDVARHLVGDGIFITSGIILKKIEDVSSALIENGFEILEVKEEGEWSCIIARLK